MAVEAEPTPARPVLADPADAVPTPGGVLTNRAAVSPFQVHLDVYSGPFDVLLGLISKHKLDITEIALAKVTDEFIAHIRAQQTADRDWDLSQASEFLLVAATLLDLKAARLLPSTGEGDEEDLALIEARDLLFARLLQYRAFKEIASWMDGRMSTHGRITARQAGLELRFAALLPELVLGISPEQLAVIAARAMIPKVPPTVATGHVHAPTVSVQEQARHLVERLRRLRVASFRTIVADAENTLVIVARFLALLELYRDGSVVFEQAEALSELTIRWSGSELGSVEVDDEFDELDQLDEVDEVDEASDETESAPREDDSDD